ncbi:hypothetical protein KBY65_13265 [Cyanobium sp. Alchichica 3B3-8F6]|uniref:hypothetical protein n=1 Tax=Synechococcales TaxID=1890424 RepID=UPI000B999D7B|nr:MULTISPECIES: hypothetical protein [Synechococcales]MCP9883424.1 hypothetical protein [Cyanobium sp. Alchichica 3B3-8F6]
MSSSGVRCSSHLSRHLAALRQQRDLKPGQLAARLGASNLSKVGSLIRAFELGEPISDHWLEKLIAELQPDPAELRLCLALDQAEALEQLERERVAWEAWADEPIDPFLTIRYMPAVYGVREIPKAFCTPRESAEDQEWARDRAEGWAAAELKRLRAKGFLSWSRRERTWFDQYGVNPGRRQVTFEGRMTGAWMQVSGSQQRFLLGSNGEVITRSHGLDHP